MFGIRGNPRVYSWGNLGATRGSAAVGQAPNSLLAVGRRSEGGNATRNYVPFFDSSTSEPVVDRLRLAPDERAKECFVSLDASLRGDLNNTVLAVDGTGHMWSWGYASPLGNITSLSNPQTDPTAAVFTRPVPVVANDERAADARLHKWKKVACSRSNITYAALSTDGKLYAAGNITPLLLDSHTATASFTMGFVPVSTQTWHDVTLFKFGAAAIREDRTLWVKTAGNNPGNGMSGETNYPSLQVKGFVEFVSKGVNAYTHSTSTASSISFSIDPSPSGVSAFASGYTSPDNKVRVRISSPGWGYTAAPSVVLTSNLQGTSSAYSAVLAADDKWESLDNINGRGLLALQKSGGTSKLFVFTDSLPYVAASDGLYTDTDGFNRVQKGLISVRFADGREDQPFAEVRDRLNDIRSVFGSKGGGTCAQVFCVTNSSANQSNVLAWGSNEYGQLAVGSTAAKDEVSEITPVNLTAASPEFIADRVAASGVHTLAIREGLQVYGGSLRNVRHLYTCGKHSFAGNTTATANMTTFQPCTGGSVNGSAHHWNHVFAFSYEDADVIEPEQISFASLRTVTESVVQ